MSKTDLPRPHDLRILCNVQADTPVSYDSLPGLARISLMSTRRLHYGADNEVAGRRCRTGIPILALSIRPIRPEK